jgi:hypothetical protein
MALYLTGATKKPVCDGLVETLQFYLKHDFTITELCSDRAFVNVAEQLRLSFGFNTNFASAQEHVPEIERTNRLFKERIRAGFMLCPFHAIPRLMVIALVQEMARKTNFFPARAGLSKHYSPRAILTAKKLDYNAECAIPQFSYVLAPEENDPSNTPKPRMLDCIYLRPLTNHQGGHQLLHLATKKVITRHVVTPVPMTDAIIKLVEAMAAAEGSMQGMKIQNKEQVILWDSAWLAGVDYHKKKETYNAIETHTDEDTNSSDSSDYSESGSESDSTGSASHDSIDPNELSEDPSQPDPKALDTTVDTDDSDDDSVPPGLADPSPDSDDEDSDDEDEEEEDAAVAPPAVEQTYTTRSGRASRAPSNYIPTMKGKSYAQKHRKTTSTKKLKTASRKGHKSFAQAKPSDPSNSFVYESREEAIAMATIMSIIDERLQTSVE